MSKAALIVMTHGVEDMEAVAPIDVLTRCGVEVIIAALEDGPVKAANGNTLIPHTTVGSVADNLYDAIIIPGGAKNAHDLAASEQVVALVRKHHEQGKIVASICASPGTVLAEAAGIMDGRRATGDPGFANKLAMMGAVVSDADVVVDGKIITGRGPGAALAFGLAVAETLVGAKAPNELAERWRIDR